jgi:hypothetical protein
MVLLDPVAIATITELTATTVPDPDVGPVAINVCPTKLLSAPTALNNESPSETTLYAVFATSAEAAIAVRS